MANNKAESSGCLSTILRMLGINQVPTESKTLQDISTDFLPYRIRDDFLSSAEKSFYQVLNTVVGNRAIVCPKVKLIDIFYVPRQNENLSYRGKIAQKHIDFLLCSPGSMQPLAGIELDDSSHSRSDRQKRDEFVDQVFLATELPLIRFAVQYSYSPVDLDASITPYLGGAKPAPSSSDQSNIPITPSKTVEAGKNSHQEVPLCPKCGLRMVVRTARQGEYQGKQFYGCPNYPKCQQILPIRD